MGRYHIHIHHGVFNHWCSGVDGMKKRWRNAIIADLVIVAWCVGWLVFYFEVAG